MKSAGRQLWHLEVGGPCPLTSWMVEEQSPFEKRTANAHFKIRLFFFLSRTGFLFLSFP